MNSTAPLAQPAEGWGRRLNRWYHRYGQWLVSISWWRFLALSVLLIVAASMLEDLFTWKITEGSDRPVVVVRPRAPEPPPAPAPPAPPATPGTTTDAPATPAPAQPPAASKSGGGENVTIRIGEREVVRIHESKGGQGADKDTTTNVHIDLSGLPEPARKAVREAVDDARRDIENAVREARKDAAGAGGGPDDEVHWSPPRVRTFRLFDALDSAAVLWIIGSAILKATYKRQQQAETIAAAAVQTAEAEQWKRQVAEARVAAMQAQIEPHFLFNTLASIDHLIETDPPRASQMQKHLIALLRASMPTMRETQESQAPRPLARELAVIEPYLAILKVRMDDRLETRIDVPPGLRSAEFPAMMLTTLVENAIKHGLEPKPEGGRLEVVAAVEDGRLAVSVQDNGMGFPPEGQPAATAGTGVGLANIRERLALRYGARASLTLEQPAGGGTRATIRVPYQPLTEA